MLIAYLSLRPNNMADEYSPNPLTFPAICLIFSDPFQIWGAEVPASQTANEIELSSGVGVRIVEPDSWTVDQVLIL